ncbi:MAG TPA: outer membrane beta-barrel protein, partial [Chitinophagaceae bacterium]
MKKFSACINKNTIHFTVFILFTCFGLSSFSQQITVNFKIANGKNEPVPYASFIVMKRSDSSAVQRKAADSSGLVKFLLSQGTQYIVRISSTNYQPVEKGITVNSGHTSFSFVTESLSKTMQGVVVTSKAPFMKQEDDKTIVDPEPIAAASTNAYEILEKTPGVFVDQDGNVYLSSMTPATIYINGRELKMSTADVATMLKNLPPTAIAKIEILRTPSAKYDASGTGGIVNIILRKGVKLGMTGSVTAGLQQGSYGNQFVSFNLNNNDGKKSSSFNLNYSKRNSFEQIQTNHLFAPDSMLSQLAYTKYPGNSYYGSYGLSNELKRNWNIDVDGGVSYNDFNNNTDNFSIIRTISNADTLANNLNRVNNNGFSLNIRGGLDFTRKIDTAGSQWDNDIFYNYNQNNSTQSFSTIYYLPVSPLTGGDGTSDGRRNLFTARSDLKLKMEKRFTLETGVKSSMQDFRNVANYFDGSGGVRAKDDSRTNTFHYRENINAAYLQGSKTFWKNLIVKAGLRVENTNMDGHQLIPFDTSFAIHRTDFFPYVYLSKKVITIAGYELRSFLVYRRTITRP